MKRLVCTNCDQWGFYLQFLPHHLYHTIANVKDRKKKTIEMPPFNYCGWCGSKLVMQKVGPSNWEVLKYIFSIKLYYYVLQ